MNYWQWDKYGVEGPPLEELTDPLDDAQSLVDKLKYPGSEDENKKKLARDIVTKGLPLRRGRRKGSVKDYTVDAWNRWVTGELTISQLCDALKIPPTEKHRLDARMRSRLRKLPEHQKNAILVTRRRARQARRAAARRGPNRT